MIALLENAQTRHKGSLNFVDDRGKVVGFNPAPDGARLKYQLRAPSGRRSLRRRAVSRSFSSLSPGRPVII